MAGPLSGIGQQQTFTQFQPGGNNNNIQQTRDQLSNPAQSGAQPTQDATQPQGTQAAQTQQAATNNNQNAAQQESVIETQLAEASGSGSEERGSLVDIEV